MQNSVAKWLIILETQKRLEMHPITANRVCLSLFNPLYEYDYIDLGHIRSIAVQESNYIKIISILQIFFSVFQK